VTVFVPAGAATSALTHFALYGLAAILEDENGQSVRLCWTDEADPKPQLDAELEPGEVAAAVHRHATRCASPESWLGVRFDAGDRHLAAFSPRVATPSTPSAWHHLQETRHAGLDAVAAAGSELDLRMIGALGEPAYWPLEHKSTRGVAKSEDKSDGGASRWEMKTRNRGAEFVGNRLLPLAHVVASRTIDGVRSGLVGQTIRDEAGNDKPDSRSGTGFTRPGPGRQRAGVVRPLGHQSIPCCSPQRSAVHHCWDIRACATPVPHFRFPAGTNTTHHAVALAEHPRFASAAARGDDH